MTTFLGMPVTAPRGVGNLRGDEPFPAAAHKALGNAQLRGRGGFVRRRRPSELDEEAVRHVSQRDVARVHSVIPR